MKDKIQELQSKGICPTCYNMKHGGIYEDFTNRLLYEDDVMYCFFEIKPRAIGHTIILTKEHYNDMSYLPDDICDHIFRFSKLMMNALKEALDVPRVYLCTMCDGDVNHAHIQLIPRYSGEKIGSSNFVKERTDYVENKELLDKIKKIIQEKLFINKKSIR